MVPNMTFEEALLMVPNMTFEEALLIVPNMTFEELIALKRNDCPSIEGSFKKSEVMYTL